MVLSGKTIALPETRDMEAFAQSLEELGAAVLRCPLVGILDTPDQAAILAWLEALVAGSFDDVILFTGEGLRRLMDCARRHALERPVIEALSKVRKITRGPKPARELTAIGLRPDYPSAAPTTAGVLETLRQIGVKDRRVGVQLYGENPNLPLREYLADTGALPSYVAPYIYAPAAHDESVRNLIQEMSAGRIDVLAFTSGPQVERLAEVAEKFKLNEVLAEGRKKTKLAVIGPVAAQALAARGWTADIMPAQSFVWKVLRREIVSALSAR